MADDQGPSALGGGWDRLEQLVLNVTLQCPLRCAHCCFSSDMFQEGCLSPEDVARAIDQAAQIPSLRIVHFVGGDPLLHPQTVGEGIARAAALGLQAGITTSAFWAKTPARARAILAPLKAAGLTEITISYDDAHAEFVRLRSIRNAVEEARAQGLLVRVAVVVETGSTITARSLRTELGLDDAPEVKVYQTVANSTGRAAEADPQSRQDRALHRDAYRGACDSVLTTAEVDHKGGVRPCCGVLPHTDALKVGDLDGEGVAGAMRRAARDPLLRWISLEGPVAILEQITAGDAAPLRAETFDGICTACDRLFGSPELLARARASAAAMTAQLDLAEQALRLLAPAVG